MFFGGPGMSFGGMGGGGDPRGRGNGKPADTTKLYEVLGVDKDVDDATLKKAYKKAAMKHHPDKGGDPELFKELGKAYEVLSDPEKRSIYDKYGEEGLENGGASSDPTDIFDLFFGGGGGGGMRGGGKRKGEDIVHPVKVTLEDIYNGKTRKMAINRDIICHDCDGVGGPKEAMQSCSGCKGRGMKISIRQMGPMIQQVQQPCNDCHGQGKSMPKDKQCKKCNGDGTVRERKVLDVFVEKGAPDQKKVFFRGEADEKPGTVAGDVVFVIQQQDHPMFKRRKNHLVVEKKISLLEALTGFSFELTHLDKRKLIIKSPPGGIIKPGDVKAIPNEGMPTAKNPFVKGLLIISFSIEFPDKLDAKQAAALKAVLPPPLNDPMVDADSEIHYVEELSANRMQEEEQREAYDEEDDEDGAGGNPKVQCRQG